MSKPRAIIGCIVCELIIILAICFVLDMIPVFVILIAGLLLCIFGMIWYMGESESASLQQNIIENEGERIILFDDENN